MNPKNKWTLSPLGFDPDLSGPVGAGGETAPVWSVSLILRSTNVQTPHPS